MAGAAAEGGMDTAGAAGGAISGADSGARTAALGSANRVGVGWLPSFSARRPPPKISRSALLIARGWPTHPFRGRARTACDSPMAGTTALLIVEGERLVRGRAEKRAIRSDESLDEDRCGKVVRHIGLERSEIALADSRRDRHVGE